MDERNFYIFTDGSDVPFGIRLLIVGAIFFVPTFMLMGLYMYHDSIFSLELLIMFYVSFVPILTPFVFYEYFDKKYVGKSKLRLGVSYQFISRYFSFYAPLCICLCILLGQITHHFMMGIYLALSAVIPFSALFFRLSLFNDSSCILGDEIVLGYSPRWCGILSLIVGLFGIYNIFRFYYVDFNYFICCLAVVLIFQFIFVIPDVFNRFLPFELRTRKGFSVFALSIIAIYLIVLILTCGSLEFVSINFTFESIVRNCIYLGISLIIILLYYRQAKKMGR